MTRAYADLLETIRERSFAVGDCLLFAGTDNGHGYMTISGDYAHRHVHRLCIGPIPDGYEVDHLCFRRACVNPAHLEAVTPAENFQRARARKTRCVNDHPLPDPVPGENRPCATCHAMRQAKQRQRIRDGLRPPVEVKDDQHGTLTGYSYGCRCESCRSAQREHDAARGRATGAPRGPRPGPVRHGTLYAYNKHRCRCDECRSANTAAARQYRALRRSA